MTSDPWPWPGDSPLDRARRVALSYREVVRIHMPELCARMDAHMAKIGQTWVVPQVAQYQPMDLLTARQAADYCQIEPGTLQTWKARGLKVTETPDGRRYKVSDLDEYTSSRRQRRMRGVA